MSVSERVLRLTGEDELIEAGTPIQDTAASFAAGYFAAEKRSLDLFGVPVETRPAQPGPVVTRQRRNKAAALIELINSTLRTQSISPPKPSPKDPNPVSYDLEAKEFEARPGEQGFAFDSENLIEDSAALESQSSFEAQEAEYSVDETLGNPPAAIENLDELFLESSRVDVALHDENKDDYIVDTTETFEDPIHSQVSSAAPESVDMAESNVSSIPAPYQFIDERSVSHSFDSKDSKEPNSFDAKPHLDLDSKANCIEALNENSDHIAPFKPELAKQAPGCLTAEKRSHLISAAREVKKRYDSEIQNLRDRIAILESTLSSFGRVDKVSLDNLSISETSPLLQDFVPHVFLDTNRQIRRVLEQSEENFLTVEEMVRKMEVTILNSEFWSGSGERKETTQSALHETRLALKKTESENDRLKSRISLMQKKVECLISENQELSAINARNETHFRHKLEQSELLIESLRKSIEELTSGRN